MILCPMYVWLLPSTCLGLMSTRGVAFEDRIKRVGADVEHLRGTSFEDRSETDVSTWISCAEKRATPSIAVVFIRRSLAESQLQRSDRRLVTHVWIALVKCVRTTSDEHGSVVGGEWDRRTRAAIMRQEVTCAALSEPALVICTIRPGEDQLEPYAPSRLARSKNSPDAYSQRPSLLSCMISCKFLLAQHSIKWSSWVAACSYYIQIV